MTKAKVVWKGSKQLEQFRTPIKGLKPYPKNPRIHDEKNIEAIRRAFEGFGQMYPVVVRKGVLLAGNGRWMALQQSGWTHIAAVSGDHLTDAQAEAFVIADNRTAELGEWNYEALSDSFKRLSDDDLKFSGWDPPEIEPLRLGEWKPPRSDREVSEEGAPETFSFRVTSDQATIIKGAIAKVQEKEKQDDMSDGRCLELLCADWLSGQ